MNLILLGPPGAGKGTQAELIIEKFNIPHISTGDIFRAAVKEGTPMGLEAQRYMASGGLVPDEVVIGIVEERLVKDDCQQGFLLDGFPRTVPQADALAKLLGGQGRVITGVLNIVVAEEILLARLTGRRVCRDCAAVYHVQNKPEKVTGVCNYCGGQIYQREDDTPATVSQRIKVYWQQTEPLIKYYEQQGILHSFNGEEPMPVLFKQICLALGVNN